MKKTIAIILISYLSFISIGCGSAYEPTVEASKDGQAWATLTEATIEDCDDYFATGRVAADYSIKSVDYWLKGCKLQAKKNHPDDISEN